MSDQVEVIGIGAINLDFIFSGQKSDNRSHESNLDSGEETFIKDSVF